MPGIHLLDFYFEKLPIDKVLGKAGVGPKKEGVVFPPQNDILTPSKTLGHSQAKWRPGG